MMRRLICLSVLLLAAACTQKGAPVEYRGSYFYGLDGPVGNNGMEAPKYSDDRRADLPPEQEVKYKSDVHDYGVAAEVGGVAEADLPPPSDPMTPPNPPQQAVDAYKAGGTGTVVDPKLNRTPEPGEGYYDYKAQAIVPPITERAGVSTPTPPAVDPNASQEVDYYSKEAAEVEAASAPPAFIWPVRGDIVTPYSASTKGIAITAAKGDPVRAAADGSVLSVSTKGGQGTVISVSHPGNWTSQYAQLGESVVRVGDQVVRGQLVGFAGGAQVFFGVTKAGQPADPRAMLVDD